MRPILYYNETLSTNAFVLLRLCVYVRITIIILFVIGFLLTSAFSLNDASAEENTVTATITVGDRPDGIAFDSANNRMYVTNYNDDNVSVINTATNVVDATITVGDGARGIAFEIGRAHV